jgi:hypothetical protein
MKKDEEKSLNIFWFIWRSYRSDVPLFRSQRLSNMLVRDIA